MQFSKENNEFAVTECVICMDEFPESEPILRIPTCRHFFHPHCARQWFDSKSQEEE